MNRVTTTLFAAAAALASVVWASSAEAALSFKYQTDPASTFTSNGSGTVSVPLYIYETRSAGDTSLLLNSGLYSASFSVTRGTSTPTGSVASISGNITGNTTAFPGNTGPTSSASSASLDENRGNTAGGATGTAVDALTTRLLVGTLTVSSATISGSTTFSIADMGDTVRNDTGTALSGVASSTFSVATVVPEPASLGLLGLGAMTILRRRVRN